MWDVIVIGLGPAGSTAARCIAETGLKVLALDRATFPRRKTCAGGLTLRAQKYIPLELSDYFETAIHSIEVALNRENLISITQSEPFMFTTRRERLDAALVEKARVGGAVIKENCYVKSFQYKQDIVYVDVNGETEKARFLIGCDGVNSVVRRANHFSKLRTLPAWEAEYKMTDNVSDTEKTQVLIDMGIVKRGYGWIFPKRETFSIGIAGRFHRRSEIEQAVQRLLKHYSGGSIGTMLEQSGHLLPIFNPSQPLSCDGILLAGDAAGLVDPFIGEGLYYAFASGVVAAEWVKQNIGNRKPEYSAYKIQLMKVLGRDLLISSRLADLVYSLPKFMFVLADRKPEVLKRYAASLSDDFGHGYADFIRSLPWYWQLFFWNV
ncbi:MAG: geranylgeranyl reductase family protein [bacterium]